MYGNNCKGHVWVWAWDICIKYTHAISTYTHTYAHAYTSMHTVYTCVYMHTCVYVWDSVFICVHIIYMTFASKYLFFVTCLCHLCLLIWCQEIHDLYDTSKNKTKQKHTTLVLILTFIIWLPWCLQDAPLESCYFFPFSYTIKNAFYLKRLLFSNKLYLLTLLFIIL